MKKLAFTLAEILIVLVVIGVITAILLPVAIQSSPDEKVMKFKKGNATLGKVISELINNDKYYGEDFSKKPDGTHLLGGFANCSDKNVVTNDETVIKYFCETFADVVSTKSVNCSTVKTGGDDYKTFIAICDEQEATTSWWKHTIEEGKELFDKACLETAESVGEEIVTTDDIVFYQANPQATFGIVWGDGNNCLQELLFSLSDSISLSYYKPFCMDIDGINKGEPPFGYGIRIDGKILTGKRADEWINKSMQKGDS